MAKFRYSMQSILDLKTKLEGQAKQEFATAQSELRAEERKRDELKARKEQYLEENRRRLTGVINIRDIKDGNQAVAVMDRLITDQQAVVMVAGRKADAAMVKYTKARQEMKVQEKLREKALLDYIVEENRKEGKVNDELTSYSYTKRRAEISNGEE